MATSRGNLRDKTFVINFSEALKKPRIETITDYMFKVLVIPTERLKSVQANLSRGVTYVEVDTEEYALEVVELHDRKHEVKYNDYKFLVPLYMEDGTTQVRVHDLPPQMDNELIKSEMGRFGEVLAIKDEVWDATSPLKGIKNGVRTIRIRIHEQIPSYVNIAGHFTLITHKNQIITCRHCCKPVHIGLSCAEAGQVMQNRTNVNNRLNRNTSSYAGQLRLMDTQAKMREEKSIQGNNVLGQMTNLNDYNKEQRLAELSKKMDSNASTTRKDVTTISTKNDIEDIAFKVPAGPSGVSTRNAFAELMEQGEEDDFLSDTSLTSVGSTSSRKRQRRNQQKSKVTK